MNTPTVVTPTEIPPAIAPTSATSKAPRAIRTTGGFYRAEDCSMLAINGSVLDRQRHASVDFSYSSAWLDPACKGSQCFLPPFRHLVPFHALRCPAHGFQALPAENPYPKSEREDRLGEEREWAATAIKLQVPVRFRLAHLERSQQTAAIKAVRRCIDDHDCVDKSQWLAGPTGTGKTWAMIAALRHDSTNSYEGESFVFYPMRKLVRALISEESDQVLESCLEATCLYIDDVGSAYLKDGGLGESLFEEIVCSREADEKPMICTTNLTLPRLAEVLGDRIADRIRGPWAEWVALPGDSLRRKARPKSEHTSMRGGYVKLFRSLADHRIWLREPFTMGQFWAHLLMIANYKPSRVLRGRKWVEVGRGQVFTSIESLRTTVSRDRKTIKAWLLAFASDGMLDIETAHGADGGYTLLTIRNFEKYQGAHSDELDDGLDNASDNGRDDGLDNAGDDAGDDGGDISKKLNNPKNRKEGRSPSPSSFHHARGGSENGGRPSRKNPDREWGRK